MLATNALLRRYTPPTCTLEIWGKRSLLSLWAGRSLLQDVRFELYLDDPRQLSGEPNIIQGDRQQLQNLCAQIQHYTQNWLTQTAPTALTQHRLTLDEQTPLTLSATQLFDLANALEEYSQEAELLPQLDTKLKRQSFLTWIVTTAALVTALGFPLGMRYWQQIQAARLAQNTLPNVTSTPLDNSLEVPRVPLPPSPLPPPTLPPTITEQSPLNPPSGVQPLPAPPRNPNIPLVVPPPPLLPPPPLVPAAPPQAIVIAPNPQPLPNNPPITRAPAELPPGTLNLNPPAPNLPKLPPLESSPSAPTTPTTTLPQTNLLDTIPQVAEVRQYFQERWQPPESLTQTLEYRLTLNKDGSLGRITPLGQAAKIYLDRTSMPLLGEPFVTPLESSLPENPDIRLVLGPDRTVRTFMEQTF